MKGEWMHVGLAAILGVLAALENQMVFGILFLFLLFLLWIQGRLRKQNILFLVGGFLILFVNGCIHHHQYQSKMNGNEQNFAVMIQSPIKIDGNFFSSYSKVIQSDEKVVMQYTIPTKEEKERLKKLQIGTVCKVRGKLEEPSPSRNGETFNYQEYLRHQHVFWLLKIEELNWESCKVEKNPITFIQNMRQDGLRHIDDYFPHELASLANALIFGESGYIDPELMTAYQRLGIVHLLAISGLHVTMLVGLLLYTGIRLEITREKMTTVLMAAIPVYMVLAGASPSVNRACLSMFIVLCLIRFNLNKKLLPSDILSIVLMIYLFYDPCALYHAGFQLSFAVTFALILSGPIFAKYLLSPVLLLMVTSFISQLASMPILLFHFYELSLISMIVNVLFIPLYSIITPIIILLFMSHLFFGNLIVPFIFITESFLHLLNGITRTLSSFPYSTLILGRPHTIFLILYIVGIPFFLYKWESLRLKRYFFLLLIIPMAIIGLQFASNKWKIKGEVTVIDVGQGDSILIDLPFNKGTCLIDTGGLMQFPKDEWEKRQDPFETGKDILVPYLKSKGITKLDKLILTHGDMDHAGGAEALLSSIKVKEIVLPQVHNISDLEKNILQISKEKQIPVHFANAGDYWSFGEHVFKVLSPISGENSDKNNSSIVVYTELGGLKWLFTGDLEGEGEEKLLSSFKPLPVDVLKVGHHGSKTSTTDGFLEKIKPKYAIISVGERNRFGHPHPEVLDRLRKRNINIFRTDKHGAVSYYFFGDKGTFFTQLP